MVATPLTSAFECSLDEAKEQWKTWTGVLKDDLPIEHCLGNHDICGNEVGKKLALETLRIEPYRSFNKNGWHFIILDSTFVDGRTYQAKLDDEQFRWLVDDLKEARKCQ